MADTSDRKPPRGSGRLVRRLLLVVLVLALTLALAEGVASLFLAGRSAASWHELNEQSHSRYDPQLGWSHEPGSRLVDLYGPGRTLSVNAQGLRATRDYAREVPAGMRRVLCLGDSFTMGYGVGDEHTFAARLEALCDGLEAVNMGQGGYGLDQAWLWYERDGARLQADVVLFAFIDADFYRMQKDVFSGYPKPRLRVEGGELVTGNVPVPRTFGESGWRRRLEGFVDGLALARLARPAPPLPTGVRAPLEPELDEVDSLALLELAEHVIDAVHATARERGSRLVLAYIPTKKLLYVQRTTRIQKWVERYARERELPLIDLRPVFDELEPSAALELFLPDNHFDVEGNAMLAQGLLDGLREAAPDVVPCAGD